MKYLKGYTIPILLISLLGVFTLAYAGHALHVYYIKWVINSAVKQECLK